LTLKRNVLEDEGLLQSLDIEESQCRNEHVVGRPCQPSLLNQEQLKLTNIVGPELIGRAMEVLGDLGYTAEIGTDGCRRVVSPLEFFQHALSKAADQRSVLRSFSAIRAFTNLFTRAADGGLSTGKRMVPLDVWKFLSSFLNSFMADRLPGNKLQW